MKTAISIPDPIFQSAELLANQLGVSRSELYAKAVSEFVRRNKRDRVTEQLNQVYPQENSQLDDTIYQIQLMSIDREEW